MSGRSEGVIATPMPTFPAMRDYPWRVAPQPVLPSSPVVGLHLTYSDGKTWWRFEQWENLYLINTSLFCCLYDLVLEFVRIDLVQGSCLKYQQLMTEGPLGNLKRAYSRVGTKQLT